ncbi:hypothetical protein Clacol_005819 [Clathrus columnatus]|uniref:C2H2-type domain-containing protein n=1 Tax=Clathrus columnatus TaxID=1419009 RepID=A0AAV5AEH0_9AGAM|nr:hypothetical protein Clacol_005819 [Clathrus columnatus]
MQFQHSDFEPSTPQQWQHRCVKRKTFAKVWMWTSVHNVRSGELFLAVCLYPDCPDRGQIFTSKEVVEQHIDQCHCGKEDQPYVCVHPRCYKWYAHRVSAHRHETGERDGLAFQCSVPGCEKSFSRKDACNVHERSCLRRNVKEKIRHSPYPVSVARNASTICL